MNTGSGDVDATEVIAVFYRRYGKAGALKKLDMLVEQQARDVCETDEEVTPTLSTYAPP